MKKKINAKNNNCSLLLPVKDRHNYSVRFLDYLSKKNCCFPIYIADGSLKSKLSDYVNLEKYNNLNLTYRSDFRDEDFSSFVEKMNKCVSGIKTDYVIWVSDDDFISFEALERALTILENNSDIVAVTGRLIDFKVYSLNRNARHVGKFLLDGERYSMKDEAVEDTPLRRLEHLRIVKPFEALHRTKTLQDWFQIASDTNTRHHYQLDHIGSALTLLSGKFVVLDTVWLLRQHNTINSAGDQLLSRKGRLHYYLRYDVPSYLKQGLIPGLLSCLGSAHITANVQAYLYYDMLLKYDLDIRNSMIERSVKWISRKYAILYIPAIIKHIMNILIYIWTIFKLRGDTSENIVGDLSVDPDFLADVKSFCEKEPL